MFIRNINEIIYVYLLKSVDYNLVRWCCVNEKEYEKCMAWSTALLRSNLTLSSLACVAGSDKFDCYLRVFNDQADLMTADSGEIYTAGKYYNLVPIANELYASIFKGKNVQARNSFIVNDYV